MNGRVLLFLVIPVISLGCQSTIERVQKADSASTQTSRYGDFQGQRDFREMLAAKEMRIEEKRAELDKLTREVPALQDRATTLTAELSKYPEDRNLQSKAAAAVAQLAALQGQVDRARSDLLAAQEALMSAKSQFTPIPHDLLTNPSPTHLF